MPDGIDIKVTAAGAQKAEADLKKVARAEGQLASTAKKGGRDAASSAKKHSQALGDLEGSALKAGKAIASMVGSYVGLQGVLRALALIRAEHEKIRDVTIQAADAMRAVLALTMTSAERRQAKADASEISRVSGRPIEEVGPAYYSLLGGTVGMDRGRQKGLMMQAALASQTDPRTGLDPLAKLMSTLGTQQPGLSPLQIGNLLSKTGEAAKAEAGEMAAYMPQVMTAGKLGGVDPATAAAMFSFATRSGGGVAKSATAVTAMMMGLLAPSKATAQQLRLAGMPTGDVMKRMQWMARNGDKLPPELQEAVGGRRGIEAIAAIVGDPKGFAAEQAAATGAMGAKESLFAGRLKAMYTDMPEQMFRTQAKAADVALDASLQDPNALLFANVRRVTEHAQRAAGLGVVVRWVNRAVLDAGSVFAGGHAPTAVMDPSEIAAMEMLREGYSVEAIAPILGDVYKRGGVPMSELGNTASENADAMRSRLRAAGARPLTETGGAPTYVGGTHFHTADRVDPAGKAPDLGVQP